MTIDTIVTSQGQFMYDRFHFAEATRHGDLLLCSGIIGTNDKGKLPETVEDEFNLAWSKVKSLLEGAGSSLDDILEYTTYHVGLQTHMAAFMEVRDRYLSEPWPAWTAIGITELAVPGAHVEIRVTARTR
ncbi:MAG: RidA family protein [Gammaproteobacteria bacterium]|nr:RidA family protein [Gammaproteobacteria bacterium]